MKSIKVCKILILIKGGGMKIMKVNAKSLSLQVITAIILGVIIGYLFPSFGVQLKLLPDVFIKLIKMVIPPIVFFTIAIGIAGMQDIKKIGRVGGKALLYFEIVSTIALFIGLLVVNVVKPGVGFDMSTGQHADVSKYTKAAAESEHDGFINFLVGIIPDSVMGAFAKGELLPILFFSVLFGLALAGMGERAKPITNLFEKLMHAFFSIVSMIMKISPLAAFGAMAFTVENFGVGTIFSLGKLVGSVYITMFIFIVFVLGGILRFHGFNLFSFLKYIKEEIILTFGTCSSEPALPSLMKKLEDYGCSKSVVGFVLPTGYSFNLDGTSIYLSMAAMFIAQAYGVDMSIWKQLTFMGILMLTSKGAAAVTGGGFVTLGATLAAFPTLPIEGLALLLGVDRFLAEARGITNLIGNAVATLVISKTEGEFRKDTGEVVGYNKEKSGEKSSHHQAL
jgi:aerobic C4-dicarboxylate transport protein